MLPSNTFSGSQFLQEITQTACVAPSLSRGIDFYVSQKVASLITFIPPFTFIPYLPSALVQYIAGKDEDTFNKISWLAPVSGITIASLAAHKFYAMSNNFLTKGFICGAHSTAMMLFTYVSADWIGFITLKSNLKDLILNKDRLTHLEHKELTLLDARTETITSVAFLVSNISLTLIFKNPILANTVSYPLASLVKIVAMRVLS